MAIAYERTFVASGVGPNEDPVLPSTEPAEDFRVASFGTAEAKRSFHAGERIGRKRSAFFDGNAHVVFPVEILDQERGEARFERRFGVELRLLLGKLRRTLRLAEEAVLKAS